jgi:ABC-type proline/glycine betaine transport system ATPase subunit
MNTLTMILDYNKKTLIKMSTHRIAMVYFGFSLAISIPCASQNPD